MLEKMIPVMAQNNTKKTTLKSPRDSSFYDNILLTVVMFFRPINTRIQSDLLKIVIVT